MKEHWNTLVSLSLMTFVTVVVTLNGKTKLKNNKVEKRRKSTLKISLVNPGSVGIDFGEEISNIVYYENNSDNNNIESAALSGLPGQLHFVSCNSSEIESHIRGLRDCHTRTIKQFVGSRIESAVGAPAEFVEVFSNAELGYLLRGISFAVTHLSGECFTYRNKPDRPISQCEPLPTSVLQWFKDVPNDTEKVTILDSHNNTNSNSSDGDANAAPYLLVHLDSAVNILLVTSDNHWEKVFSSSIGRDTFTGLSRLLTGCKSLREALKLAGEGDAGRVDLSVQDIYGGDYGGLLLGAMTAASLGKLSINSSDSDSEVSGTDKCMGLLMAVTLNIGQVVCMNAQLHKCSRVMFTGSFIRGSECEIVSRRVAFSVDIWSGHSIEALFLQHEPFLPALGAFLHYACEENR